MFQYNNVFYFKGHVCAEITQHVYLEGKTVFKIFLEILHYLCAQKKNTAKDIVNKGIKISSLSRAHSCLQYHVRDCEKIL